jgi:hypothetical protein
VIGLRHSAGAELADFQEGSDIFDWHLGKVLPSGDLRDNAPLVQRRRTSRLYCGKLW